MNSPDHPGTSTGAAPTLDSGPDNSTAAVPVSAPAVVSAPVLAVATAPESVLARTDTTADAIDFPIRACAWPRRERQGPVRMIAPDELRSWIVHEDEHYLVINKPGDVVCHPSKAGPWSSLVGAAREYTGLPTMHLIFRLDRETSGIVVLTKNSPTAARLNKAMQQRRVSKRYLALLTGDLLAATTVDRPLGPDLSSSVYVKSAVVPADSPGAQTAVTHFAPLAHGSGFTLARVQLETGRKHQIRAHAQAIGHTVVGDKIYGPDARCYLEFIDHGWSDALASRLLLPRQALHCAEIDLTAAGAPQVFRAPLPADLVEFCVTRMGLAPADLAAGG